MRAIDRLKKVAGTDAKVKKNVEVCGEDFSFWMTPLTINEQQSAEKTSKSTDQIDIGIQLLVNKALDENGQRLFQADCVPMLKREVKRAEVEKLLVAMLTDEDEEEPTMDMKSPSEATEKGKRPAS